MGVNWLGVVGAVKLCGIQRKANAKSSVYALHRFARGLPINLAEALLVYRAQLVAHHNALLK